MLKDYLKSKDISVYKLAKESGIPYTTVLELTKNKTNVYKATVGTVKTLATSLGISINKFIDVCSETRSDFELFKSNVCHMLKSQGDKKFMTELIKSNDILHYFEYGWYPESLYLLALLDYLSDLNDIHRVSDYDEIRNYKLDETLFPKDVIMIDKMNHNDDMKNKVLKESIEEFLKYNIVETNIRDAV